GGWVFGRLAERLPLAVPMPLPAKDAEARHTKTRERGSHEIRHRTQILRDDRCPRFAKEMEQLLAELDLRFLIGGREKRRAPILGPPKGPIEADQVIDPVPIVEIGTAPRALAQPPEILGG